MIVLTLNPDRNCNHTQFADYIFPAFDQIVNEAGRGLGLGGEGESRGYRFGASCSM